MIEVTNLSKAYGPIQALKDVSFSIAAGEIVGLLGPNGAGKTTIIKALTGYLQPDEGTALINELDVLEQPEKVQAQIGYLPENAPLYPELSVQSYLKMMANMRSIPDEDQVAFITEAVHAVGIEAQLARPIGQLSKGFRQRVGLAQAILHKPRMLILDEPTVGLDPTQIVEIRQLIKGLSKHSTVLFSTHILSEVEMLCDRALIIINGVIEEDARLSELAQTANAILVLQEAAPGIEDELTGIPGVSKVELITTNDNYPAYRIIVEENQDVNNAVFKFAADKSLPLRELRRDTRMLETVFNELTLTA